MNPRLHETIKQRRDSTLIIIRIIINDWVQEIIDHSRTADRHNQIITEESSDAEDAVNLVLNYRNKWQSIVIIFYNVLQ